MWVVYVIFSAVFLGIYDVFKKISLNKNAVLPVLFISTTVSFLFFSPWIILSYFEIGVTPNSFLYIPNTSWHNQGLIFIKTCLVLSSWIFSFFALKNLPISIVGPIRSTSPVWTVLAAIFLLGESLSALQWVGVFVVFISIYAYSLIGKKEGIHFRKNIWILFIFLATLFGSASGIFDKYLLVNQGIDKLEVQAWFSIYQSIILLPIVAILWWPRRKEQLFTWRWTIPLIGLFLIISDFFFFYALSLDGALISVISLVRRSGMIISFISGLVIFKEQNIKKKGYALIGVIVGVLILYIAS